MPMFNAQKAYAQRQLNVNQAKSQAPRQANPQPTQRPQAMNLTPQAQQQTNQLRQMMAAMPNSTPVQASGAGPQGGGYAWGRPIQQAPAQQTPEAAQMQRMDALSRIQDQANKMEAVKQAQLLNAVPANRPSLMNPLWGLK